jgi:tRNA A-37 threonylcarbamoyl transferase component Bud32
MTAGSGQASPRWIGKYELLRPLGSGGMGTASLARQTGPAGFARLVVVKQINAESLPTESVRRALLQEAQLTAQLRHANIVQVFDVGEHLGIPFVVMEYIKGRSLEQIWQVLSARKERMPAQHVLTVAIALCRGLHFAHNFVDEQGAAHPLVHRDIKPSNVLVDYLGRVKLIDFGLAKSLAVQGQTQTGELKGTPPYMAPEQIRGGRVDQRSDLFALGVALYTLLTGHHPFWRGNSYATLRAVLQDEPPPIARFSDELSADYQQIVSRCLAKQPADRYPSARELQRQLQPLAAADDEQREESLGQYLCSLFPDDSTEGLEGTAAGESETVAGRASPRVVAREGSDAAARTDLAPVTPRRTTGSAGTEGGTAAGVDGLSPTGGTGHLSAASHDYERAVRAERVPHPGETRQLQPKSVAMLSVADDPLETAQRRAGRRSRQRWPLLLVLAVVVGGGAIVFQRLLREQNADLRAQGRPGVGVADASAGIHPVDAALSDGGSHRDRSRADVEGKPAGRDARDGASARKALRAGSSRQTKAAGSRPMKVRRRRVVSRSKSSAAAEAPVIGTLRISTQPAAELQLASRRGKGAARWPLRRASGTITLRSISADLEVRLHYRYVDGGLLLRVESTPWSVVYPSGLRPRRTPYPGIRIGSTARRIALERPDGTKQTIVLTYASGSGEAR